MALVLEPLSSRRDLVGRALAANAEQTPQVVKLELGVRVRERLGGKVRLERLQQFEARRSRRDGQRSRRDRFGNRFREVRSVAGSEALSRQLLARGRLKLERLALRVEQLVVTRVERELAREGLRRLRALVPGATIATTNTYHGSNNIGRSEEVHGETVAIVSRLEVAVERGQDSCSESAASYISLYLGRLSASFRQEKVAREGASVPFSSPFFSDRSHCPMQGPQALARTWPPTASRSALTPSRSIVALISSDLRKETKYMSRGPRTITSDWGTQRARGEKSHPGVTMKLLLTERPLALA